MSPSIEGFSSLCSLYFIMYILQYWNPRSAEWRNAGFSSADYTATLRALRDNQRMCDYTVRFRILLPQAARAV